MREKNLQKNILATVLYYDSFDYPLTAFEVWKHLIKISNFQFPISNKIIKGDSSCSLVDVINALDGYELRRLVKEYRGFYFWRGREELVRLRSKRSKISGAKLKRLRRVVQWLRFVPYVRMIGVTGALAMKNADLESDWDVLVVLKNGKIWTGRTLVTGFLHLIGRRRHGGKIKNRICLNHFLTEGALEIATRESEPFFPASECMFLQPVFDTGAFRKFQLRNSWIKNYKPNYYLNEAESPGTLKDSAFSYWLRTAGEKIFSFECLENWLEKWQTRKIAQNPKTSRPGSFIKVSRGQLVFLPEPQGPEIVSAMRQKLEKIVNF